jgi:hypothetical protein
MHISSRKNGKSMLSMEYIPDGLTKAQWAAIKKREADDLKAKGNLGALGTTKFKSRSFEAWQKAGGKHLFPVDPKTTPYEERPYMQRKDGDWEGNYSFNIFNIYPLTDQIINPGSDLKKKGLTGKGQGQASNRLDLDGLYETAEASGQLNSASIFGSGVGLPWTSKKAAELSSSKKSFDPDAKLYANRGVATGKLSPEELERRKKMLFKPVVSKKEEAAAAPEPKKKGFFGF